MDNNNKENNTLNAQILMSFPFCTDLDAGNNTWYFESFTKEDLEKKVILGDEYKDAKKFYMMMEDYCYGILLSLKRGHKLLIKQEENNKKWANIFSLNYQEVVGQNAQKIKVKR